MDNALYHQQLNTAFYSEGKTPASASKGLNLDAHVLCLAGCAQIYIKRGEGTMNYLVPSTEPPGWTAHRNSTPGAETPSTEEEGTVYARAKKGGTGGPTGDELAVASRVWLKKNKPKALDSKVEALFRDKGWKRQRRMNQKPTWRCRWPQPIWVDRTTL